MAGRTIEDLGVDGLRSSDAFERLGLSFVLPDDMALRGLEHLAALRITLDRVEHELADLARPWATWTEIGSALGITRQAAYRRHRRARPKSPQSSGDGRPTTL